MDPSSRHHADDALESGVTHQAPVLIQLFEEWRHLTISSAALRTAHRWALPGPPFASLDEVLDRCGYATSAAPVGNRVEDEDACLLHLLRLAPTNTLAARTVLQRILPPLCAVARRHTSSKRQRLGLMDDLVANAWMVICNYPTDRRPIRVVPNLVRDITFATIVRPVRRMRAGEVPTTIEDFGDAAPIVQIEPLDELVELLHDAADVAGIEPDDVRFICELVNHGRPEHLAVTLHVTPRTIRNHRDAVIHRLRTLVAFAA